MEATSVAVAVVLSCLGASCGKSQETGIKLDGSWRSSPEDLPYTGATPVVKSVSFNFDLFSEEGSVVHGTGSLTPFFSADDYRHTQMDGYPGSAFEWQKEGGRITLSFKGGPKTACTGTIPERGDAIELQVAGCAPLSAHVSQATVRFARR